MLRIDNLVQLGPTVRSSQPSLNPRLLLLLKLLLLSQHHRSGTEVRQPALLSEAVDGATSKTGPRTAANTGLLEIGGNIRTGGHRGQEPTSLLDHLLGNAGPVTARPGVHGTNPMNLTGLHPDWDGSRSRAFQRIQDLSLIRPGFRTT